MLRRLSRLLALLSVIGPAPICSLSFAVGASVQSPASIVTPDLPPVVPAGNQLTLHQAVQTALKDNPQITAARYSVLSARENYNSQKSPINPTINYGAVNNTVAPLDFATGFGQSYNYSAYATIETNGAITYRTRQAREQYHQAQFDAATTGLSLQLNVINAYVGVQVANRALEVELKVYENMHQLSDLTEKRFEAGAGTDADARRARIAFIQERQNVIADAANVNSARAALNAQLGHPVNTPIDASEPLTYQQAPLRDLADLTKQAEQNRPELQSANANLRALKAVPGLARSAYYPDLVVARDFSGDSSVDVGLSVPLDLGSIRGAVKKAKADVKTQEAQVELARQNIDLDVKNSYLNLDAAQKQVDTYNGGILLDAEALLNQTRQAYVLGANTILDVMTAEVTYRSVLSSYYNAIGTYIVAVYTLQHSIGDLPDPLPTISLVSTGTPTGTSSKRKNAP
jgi:cobalt-zinc-cadmium efflux system outer membrane protein